MKHLFILLSFFSFGFSAVRAQNNIVPVVKAWAGNSVNAVVFRKNSLVTYKNIQFIAFYNQKGKLTLGKRKLNSSSWEIVETAFSGKIRDAHNCISIMVDGDGYLHVAWDHHVNPLNYAHSAAPLSLELTAKIPMTGLNETKVTYPEFYKMPNGNLIFLYRNGGSGKGNLVMNRYDVKSKTWTQLHTNLIDGEGCQNAYWQACVDKNGTFNISWVWRSSPNVASNHNMLFARSTDGGISWIKSTGEKYTLPINEANAELACSIPPNSELSNQTSMTTDDSGNPFIASYWRSANNTVPQYHIVYNVGNNWRELDLGFRTNPFSLSGVGTKQIPISRPQILVCGKGDKASIQLFFRDSERGDKVSVAVCNDINQNKWTISDLTNFGVGSWEPSYDTELWKDKKKLHLFVENVQQVDGEGVADAQPEMINVLEVK